MQCTGHKKFFNQALCGAINESLMVELIVAFKFCLTQKISMKLRNTKLLRLQVDKIFPVIKKLCVINYQRCDDVEVLRLNVPSRLNNAFLQLQYILHDRYTTFWYLFVLTFLCECESKYGKHTILPCRSCTLIVDILVLRSLKYENKPTQNL